MPGRYAPHPLVRGAVPERLGRVGAGEQRAEVTDVELGLGEVGERKGGGGVGGAAVPRRVEDGPRSREVRGDGETAADAGDGRVTAGPGGQMAVRAAARGGEPHAELFVAGAATPQDGKAVGRVGFDDADLVRTPVPHRPERIGITPQKLCAHRLQRARCVPAASRSGAAPSHQPSHRRPPPLPE
jgi:hypothetical protein